MKTAHANRIVGLWKTIKSDATLLYRAWKHPKTSWGIKLLITLLVIYIISPLDLIPGWLVGLGILDDVGAVLLVVGWVKSLIPQRLLEELEGKVIPGK